MNCMETCSARQSYTRMVATSQPSIHERALHELNVRMCVCVCVCMCVCVCVCVYICVIV
jgi:hypothetical protein